MTQKGKSQVWYTSDAKQMDLTFMQQDLNGYSQPSRMTLFSLGI